ncbi:hypothetical protein Ppa06_39850 [Planomonospora parontospora subsp. parontospora]|uniref:Uncharacterized protein n=2 Tax=Planomonospora parontospora TaxID=58119 RepID=A0AA37F5K8_9ACTN|nr:hypothetical protein [Planomonospora parontospora]GGK76061.1 hypothetical protein GCM10010126_39070 [Planomonospora parontospora]GII10187.1 hypothetical protein Ppa06_39850 [Planomonospora parontospora subsp. parontospora]
MIALLAGGFVLVLFLFEGLWQWIVSRVLSPILSWIRRGMRWLAEACFGPPIRRSDGSVMAEGWFEQLPSASVSALSDVGVSRRGFLTVSEEQVVFSIDREAGMNRRTVPLRGAEITLPGRGNEDSPVDVLVVTRDDRRYRLSFHFPAGVRLFLASASRHASHAGFSTEKVIHTFSRIFALFSCTASAPRPGGRSP